MLLGPVIPSSGSHVVKWTSFSKTAPTPTPRLCLLETSGYVPQCTDDQELRLGTVIPAFGSLRQEDSHKFKANLGNVVPYHLGYRVSLCLKNDNNRKVFIFTFAGEFICYDLGVYSSF